MPTDRENPILRVIRRAARPETADRPDRDLLARYAAERDAIAFETLMHRHGGVVWRVCRAVLGDAAAAEDAFQATFLVLVRKAGSIRQPDRLAAWLHGVAHRIACRARKSQARSPQLPEGDVMAGAPPDTRVDDRDAERVLHEELRRLPKKYAAPLVLCHLEGRTAEEAAEQLRWPVGTVKVYLMRGRTMLKERLTRRGVTATGVVLTPAATGAVPMPLIETTLRSAAAYAAGGAVEPVIQHLIRGELLAMTGKRMLVTLGLGLFAVGAAGAGFAALAGQPPAAPQKAPAEKTDVDRLQGEWTYTVVEMNGEKLDAAAFKGAKMSLKGNAFIALMGVEYTGTWKLDPTTTPKSLDLTFASGPEKGNKAMGIYKLDGDTWTICLAVTAKERPKEFAAPKGSGYALEVLKRVADPKAAVPLDPKTAAEMKRFAGEWEMVSGEMGGQAMPDAMAKTMKRVVNDAETTVTMGGQVYFKATIALDPTKSPRAIDYAMTEGPTKGKTQLGIYEWEDGVLRFIFAAPGEERPKDFTSKAGDGRTLSVWKRVQK